MNPSNQRRTVLCLGLALTFCVPASAFAFFDPSGPAILLQAIEAFKQATDQIMVLKQMLKNGEDTLAAIRRQKELLDTAKSAIADPSKFLADSASAWQNTFGGLNELGQAQASFDGVLKTGWSSALGVLKGQGERRLEKVRSAVLAGIEDEHRELQDHHSRAVKTFEKGYSEVAQGVAKMQVRLDRGDLQHAGVLQAFLPDMSLNTGRMVQGVAMLNSQVEKLQVTLDQAAHTVRSGLSVAQDAEQRWHDDLARQVVNFRARPAKAKSPPQSTPVARGDGPF